MFPNVIHGRVAERTELDQLLVKAVGGRSSALVIRGEAGIGKSALLDYASDLAAARGVPVLRGVGIETEAELPYAALHLMLHPYLGQLGKLPDAQAMALRAAFGMAKVPPGDRFLAGVGVLTLLSDLAGGALLVLIDDAQWMDQSSAGALQFAARRLDAEGVVMLFAVRDNGRAFHAAGLPELHLTGLDLTDAMAVLAQHSPDLVPQVQERVLQEAAGNPLALLELPAALTAEQRAGWVPTGAIDVTTVPGSGRVRLAFLDQIHSLPQAGQLMLLVAAADDTGDLAVVSKAAQRLGLSLEEFEPAEGSGLVRIVAGRVTFRHALLRSVAYHDAPVARRMAVHRALAGAFDTDAEADRRAWHLAASAVGPDESVAVALEQSAEHARARGGYAAVAAAYHRAADLTADAGRKARRLAAAARAATVAGLPELAAALTEQAAQQTSDPVIRAELARVRNVLAHEQDFPKGSSELAEAACVIAEQDPDTAALMLVDAMTASWAANDRAATEAVARVAARMGDAASSNGFLALAKDAAVHLSARELKQAVPHLRKLLEQFNASSTQDVRERANAMWWFEWLASSPQAHHEAAELVSDCRVQGAIGVLPRALMYLARALLRLGRCRDACAAGGEGLRIAQDTNQPHFAGHLRGLLACVAATEGEVERCLALSEEVLAHGLAEKGVECLQALNLLDLGRGRPEAVLARWDRLAVGAARDVALGHIAGLPDYVEAAVQAGAPERAQEPFARLETWAEATGAPGATAVALRCRALLDGGDSAGEAYRRAGELHAQDDQPFQHARTELLHGQWLRRRLQRNAARPHLRTALEIFERLGATHWIERARAELRAAGEVLEIGDRAPELLDQLTPQELQVVRLAATGLSNRDIGAQLFLSPRTVGYHLYKAYPKLGVASRTELYRLDLS